MLLRANLAASSIPANSYGELALTVVAPGPNPKVTSGLVPLCRKDRPAIYI